MNLLVNFFEDCNEEIMGKETEGKSSTVKWGETPKCENPVRFSLNDGPMETIEYMWVNIWCMLDWIIGFCHKTAEIHFLSISCSTFSLFAFHLENSTLSAHVKPALENDSSNLLFPLV